MSSEGSIIKRCGCKDSATGRRLNSGCPKLRRPGGSWSTTHGTWGYQLELPAALGRGRRILRRSGFDDRDATRAELDHARALLALAGDDTGLAVQISDLLQACKNGILLPDRDTVADRVRAGVPAAVPTTTGEYLLHWLAGRRGLSPKTIRGYGDHIRSYLIPYLGDIPLQSLRTSHIEVMFTALDARNAQIRTSRVSTDPAIRDQYRGVRPMGASSMIRLYATLRVALNDAVRRARLIPINPALSIELESGARPKARVWTPKAIELWKATGERPSPVMVWRPEQAGQFLDYAQRHDAVLYPLFELILHRGLRRGEAIGLRDYDVDLNEAYLGIVQQITTVGYTPVTRKVKSDAGDRIVPLGPTTVAGLTAYLEMRGRWQQVSGDSWPDTGLFFVRPDGQPWHPQAISDRFDHLVTRSGLPPVRLHDLRHCAATYLRHGGADLKEIQEVLGHSTIGLTSDTYTSVILELRRPNADAAANLIPREVA
ncbi:tyrosine-type recombinase/integrase [Actinoplanes sp. NPDC023936]|uniref:tyrosine-type recombinase/integrase n=1 Tax=Actinoplanes sp. NPDC023936 TaxID=3154910 RepID=UPI00340632E9